MNPLRIVLYYLFHHSLVHAVNDATMADSRSLLRQEGEVQQRSRNLLFDRLFRPSVQCVDNEAKLRDSLRKGGPIVQCRGSTITLQSAINIANRVFEWSCQGPTLFRRRTSKCTISGGSKTALFTGSPLSAKIQDIVFRDAKNSESGGAFLMDGDSGASVFFTRCTFLANQAFIGGALFLAGRLTRVVIEDCVFESNKAANSGGAINVVGFTQVTISRTTWRSNQSKKEGSAIAANVGCIIKVEDSRILNGINSESGAAIFAQNTVLDLKSTVFSGNRQGFSFVDVFIDDDDDPQKNGSFVTCDPTSKVNFCNGKDGIVESTEDGGNQANSNCQANGIVDATASACTV